FFFQAEDGIRDRNVTGVQTCALPIFLLPDPSAHDSAEVVAGVPREEFAASVVGPGPPGSPLAKTSAAAVRTEYAAVAPRHLFDEIGRASCRERAERAAGDESVKKKER